MGPGAARTATGHRRRRGDWAARPVMSQRRRRRGAWGHPQSVLVNSLNYKGDTEVRDKPKKQNVVQFVCKENLLPKV